MTYTLPAKYKWKGRKRVSERWKYFTNKDKAREYAMQEDIEYLKPVRKGT